MNHVVYRTCGGHVNPHLQQHRFLIVNLNTRLLLFFCCFLFFFLGGYVFAGGSGKILIGTAAGAVERLDVETGETEVEFEDGADSTFVRFLF